MVINKVETGEWIIDAQKLPEKYRKFAGEIDRVFNDNVEWDVVYEN